MSARRAYVEAIENRLGSRKLIWIGTRGHDARPLLEIRQLTEIYAIAAKLGSLSVDVDYSLEDHSGSRPDLDTYNFDQDHGEPANDMRRAILNSVTELTAIAAYRPFALLAALHYPRHDLVRQLAMFHERQVTFEHKPWVESELRPWVKVIPWTYQSTEDLHRSRNTRHEGREFVFRFNRSDGGAGVRAMQRQAELEAGVRQVQDGFFAIAPLLEPHVALNVGGCMFPDGAYSLHGPSMQLIGVPNCTRRRFGYCGNDFGAVKKLDRRILSKYAAMLNEVSRWLHSQGYVGAFGVDALVHDGEVYLAEVNPRFQGSSVVSARVDRTLGRPDIYMAHMAAFMGLPAPPPSSLNDLADDSPAMAQVILHNVQESAVRYDRPPVPVKGVEHELLPSPDVQVEPDAILLRIVADGSVTEDGRTVTRPMEDHVETCLQSVSIQTATLR